MSRDPLSFNSSLVHGSVGCYRIRKPFRQKRILLLPRRDRKLCNEARKEAIGSCRGATGILRLAFSFVEVSFDLGLVEVIAGYSSEPSRDLLIGRLLSRLQVLYSHPDALIAYLVWVLGDEHI